MRKYVDGFVLVILVILIIVGCVLARQEKTEETKGTEEEKVTMGDLGDTYSVPVDGLTFEKLAKCTVENSREYKEANDVLCIYNVDFRFTMIRIYLQIGSLSSVLKNLKIVFKMDDGVRQEYTIKTALPETNYEILLSRGESNSFRAVSAEWELGSVEVSDRKEFGFPIWLKGVSTLKYISNKSILVRDTYGYVINELELDGMGTVVLNQGAAYYQEVN